MFLSVCHEFLAFILSYISETIHFFSVLLKKKKKTVLLQALMALDKLEKLGLAWNKGVTDDAVERLCEAMSGLRELDLALCKKITARSLQVGLTQRREGDHHLLVRGNRLTR